MRATDGDKPAGKPIVVVDGKPYKRSRRLVKFGSTVTLVPSDDKKRLVVEVLEPVEVK